MSAQSDKATLIVARLNRHGRVSSARYFRADERADAVRYATELAELEVPHRFTELTNTKGATR